MLRSLPWVSIALLAVGCASSSPPSSNAGQAVEVPAPAESSARSDTPPPSARRAEQPTDDEPPASDSSSMSWRLSIDSADGGSYQFRSSGDAGVRMNGKVVQVDGGFRLRVNFSVGNVDGGP